MMNNDFDELEQIESLQIICQTANRALREFESENKHGHVAIALTLLDKSIADTADINQRLYESNSSPDPGWQHTVLFDQVGHARGEVLFKLLDNNANPNIVCGTTPTNRINSLWKHFKCRRIPHDISHVSDSIPVALALIDKIYDIDERFMNINCTLLQMSCIRNDTEYAKILLENGANVNATYRKIDFDQFEESEWSQFNKIRQERKETMLMSSVTGIGSAKARINTINLLINHGANIWKKDSNGGTLLHTLAVNPPGVEFFPMVELLVDYGVHNDKDKDECTAGQLALKLASHAYAMIVATAFDKLLTELFEKAKLKRNRYALEPRTVHSPRSKVAYRKRHHGDISHKANTCSNTKQVNDLVEHVMRVLYVDDK
jgi:hypothetical protein